MTKNRYEAARAALEPSVLLEQLRDMGDIGLTRPATAIPAVPAWLSTTATATAATG